MTFSDLATDVITTIGESMGTTATLSRPGGSSDAGITVVEGRHKISSGDLESGAIKSVERDWLIRCDQLTNLTKPQEDDLLTVVSGANTQTWEIIPFDTGSAAVDFTDHAENVARCHCRLIDSTPTP